MATRFGPTLVAEHLASEDGLTIDHETLRRWMLAAGLWSRQRGAEPYRQRRERKAHFGELVQLDGSFHAWYEARGPARCLITMVDDATSRSAGRFRAEETIWAAAAVLRRWIEQLWRAARALHGLEERLCARRERRRSRRPALVPRTQFGRMCAALQIQIIPASSPQAKGRVERNHGTHQDRLVKKLRRLGDRGRRGGQRVSRDHVLAAAQRALPPGAAAAEDFHRRGPASPALGSGVSARRDADRRARTGSCAITIALLQLARQSGYAPARSTVTVCEGRDGRLAIEYRGRVMQWTEVTGPPARRRRARAPPPPPPGPPVRRPRAATIIRGARRYEGIRARRPAVAGADPMTSAPVDAAGAVDAKSAPTAPWKTTDRFSTSVHTRSFNSEGDISNRVNAGDISNEL